MTAAKGSRPRSVGSVALPEGAVAEQLSRIVKSRHFAESHRLKRFLIYVVERSLSGEGDRLKGYTIGLEVFDKPPEFDPQLDTIVRVQAGKLRQRLDLYYADEGREDPLRIEIPRGSYAPIFQLALEREPLGTTPERPPLGPAGPSVAVHPFDDHSAESDRSYLADGLTEEVANALARFREIAVLAPGARSGAEPRQRVGEEACVDYALQGSVRRVGSRVRVSARLVDCESGTTLLSESFDREVSPETLFEIQDEIASHVAAEVAEPHGVIARIDSRWRRAPASIEQESYDAVLEAFAYLRAPSPARHLAVRTRLEAVVAAAPRYAGAWAMLAIVVLDELRGRYNRRPERSPADAAYEAARMAVDCDPLNANAHYALFLAHFFRGEIAAFGEAAERALSLNAASPDILADYGACLAIVGEWDRGLALVERARSLSINPSPWYFAFLAVAAYRRRAYDEALSEIRRGAGSVWHWGPLIELMILGQLDRGEEAAMLLAEVQDGDPDIGAALRRECALWNFEASLVDHFVEGWRKAGLDVS